MTLDLPSFLLGLALGLPGYLFVDRVVYPFGEWARARARGER